MPLFKKKAAKEEAAQKAADEKMAAVVAKREARKAATGDTRAPAPKAPVMTDVPASERAASGTATPQQPAAPGTGTLRGCPLDDSDYALAWKDAGQAVTVLPKSRLVTTLGQVLADKAALNAFARYLTKQRAGPHFKFWRSVEQLRRTAQRLSDADRAARCKLVHETYLADSASPGLDLPQEVMSEVARVAEETGLHGLESFLPASQHVLGLLKGKLFPA